MNNPLVKQLMIGLGIVAIIMVVFSAFDVGKKKPEEINVQKMMQEITDEKVDKVTVENNEISVKLLDGTEQKLLKEPMDTFAALVEKYGVPTEKLNKVAYEVKEKSLATIILLNVLGYGLLLVAMGALLYFMLVKTRGGGANPMTFGMTQAREMKPGDGQITFDDVAGAKEAKEELVEIVDFLKSPKKFLAVGARPPKGVLLMGAPGTGKTLLARAVAGEAEVPFFSISGSEFVEMFVGVGASRVRDLFAKAKKAAPAILFIDEIDAVGRQRGAGLGGSHDEREQTLNQILTEMDGFEVNTNVIVIAATNRPDVLDPALLRPGRFDRRVVIDLPDINDREAILKVHARNKPLDADVNLRVVAERTPGSSGADLQNILNEAAIFAARTSKTSISQSDILSSIEKVQLGPERKSHILSDAEKKITAYHEAGHALVAHLQPNADPVHKVSIISRGRAAGYTLKLPSEERKMHRRAEFIADLAVMLAGHVTEKEVFGDVTTGASSDLRNATETARDLITQYGMSDSLAPRIYGQKEEMVFLGRDFNEQRNYSEKVAEQIDHEIDTLINGAVKTAHHIITKHRDMLDAIVTVLVEKETLEREDFEKIVGKKEQAPVMTMIVK